MKKLNIKKEKAELIEAGYEFNSDCECIHARNLDMHCSVWCIDAELQEDYLFLNEYPL